MFTYLKTLFHRASNNKNLTARERSFFKAVQGAIIGLLIDAIPQIIDVTYGHQSFHFTQMAVSSLMGAFLLALAKLWFAQGDPQILEILDMEEKKLEQQGLQQITTPLMQFKEMSKQTMTDPHAAPTLPTIATINTLPTINTTASATAAPFFGNTAGTSGKLFMAPPSTKTLE